MCTRALAPAWNLYISIGSLTTRELTGKLFLVGKDISTPNMEGSEPMRVTNRGAASPISKRQNFTANSMSGRWETFPSVGRLPKAAREVLYETMRQNGDGELYVVFSYSTPIAWYSPADVQWFYVDAKYSATTSRHQSIVRMAIDTWNGESWNGEYRTVTP